MELHRSGGRVPAVLASGGVAGATAKGIRLGLRVASALLPAFGVMAATLVVILPLRLARATRYAAAPLLLGSVGGFALALPQPFGPDPIAYLRLLGTTGLFVAMLACGITAAWIALVRRRVGARAIGLARRALSGRNVCALDRPARLSAGGHCFGDASHRAAWRHVSRARRHRAVETLLWTAGVHGPAVLAAIVTPVYLTMQMQNTHAFTVHAPLPYVVVVSLFLFVFPGGAGATLPLAGLLAISRVPRLRAVGRATLVPSLFNLNEPLLFAAPVVFNPHLVLPFVGVPVVLATVTYAAVAIGLVARAAFYVPSSVPTFISTYVATQDLRAVGLAAFNIVLATVMYYPFVRAYERHLSESK